MTRSASHRPQRTRPAPLLCGLALPLLLAACGPDAGVPVPAAQVEGEQVVFQADSPQLQVLRSAPVEADATPSVEVPARLAWDDTRTGYLRAIAPGQVSAIDSAPGDRVAAGQTLAWIASPEFGAMQADSVRSAAELRQARNELDRTRELHAAGVASARELDEAESLLAAAQAEHGRSAAGVRAFGGGTRVDQRLPLRAPIAGVVVERRLSPGMHVGPDDEAPLVVVSDPDRLWLLVDVPEHLAARVAAGQPVAVETPAGTVSTTLEHVADYIDRERHVVPARAAIDNSARRFKAGQLVRARIALPGADALAIPARGLLQAGDGQVVFVDEGDGRYRRQPVQAQLAGAGRALVSDGLDAGERIVVEGGLLLQQLLDQAATAPGRGGADAAQGAP